jgi:hypothetical protein
MNADELDARINNFLERKFAKYPDLATSGRDVTRTVKYAGGIRLGGRDSLTC